MIRTESIQVMEEGYQTEDPFPHIVIDNFIKPEYLPQLLADISEVNTQTTGYTYWNNPADKCTYQKYAFENGFPPTLKSLFEELASDQFIDKVEKLTGIQPLIRNDTTLAGAGVHRIHDGGYLSMHTDFNMIDNAKHGKLDRRLNLLIYMNPDWKDEYNGHLNIGYKHSVAPILNRCVIFNTSSKSWHGHPVPLKLPGGRFRESIAFYYYTKNINGDTDFEGSVFRGTTWRV